MTYGGNATNFSYDVKAPRIQAARFAAQNLLKRAWRDRKMCAGMNPTVEEVLVHTPDFVAQHYLGLTLERFPFYPGNADIAGFLDRESKTIGLVTAAPLTAQRFTLAHEIGHYMLHTHAIAFRDRSLSAPDSSIERPPEEREADVFAAELLMPRKYLTQVFEAMFGDSVYSQDRDGELLAAIEMSRLQKETAEGFSRASPLYRGKIFARLRTYGGQVFASLADRFQVSPTAMAIQLVQHGLVR